MGQTLLGKSCSYYAELFVVDIVNANRRPVNGLCWNEL